MISAALLYLVTTSGEVRSNSFSSLSSSDDIVLELLEKTPSATEKKKKMRERERELIGFRGEACEMENEL